MPLANSPSAVLEATTQLLAPLLNTLDALQFAGRHLHPPVLPTLVEHLEPLQEPLTQARANFDAMDWPEHLADFAARLTDCTDNTQASLAAMIDSTEQENPVFAAYRAMRKTTQARAAIYPLSGIFPPISRFFTSPGVRESESRSQALADRLQRSGNPAGAASGVMHLQNEPTQRGGASLYVPEYYNGEPMPLIVALHGGSGHGADFLWSWLVAARSLGAILLSPSSTGETWSIGDPEIDHQHLQGLVRRTCETYAVDNTKLLLTGMSDGGTFSLLSGLQEDSLATHLAPMAGSFHPMLLEVAEPGRIRELPVYLVHGALDWMFPVDSARLAANALKGAGVKLEYIELEDLSHTFPTEQTELVIDWLLG